MPLVLEGVWSGTRTVILSFRHKEEALAWYNSRDRQELAKFRFDASSGDVVIVEGIEQRGQGIQSLCVALGSFRLESPQSVSLRKVEPEELNVKLRDLSYPIIEDSELKILKKDADIALEIIRHDCAHIMARAVQELWPEAKVTIGPVIENGWYYDFDREDPFTHDDLSLIEKKMREIINRHDPVRTEVWGIKEAIKFYEKNNE